MNRAPIALLCAALTATAQQSPPPAPGQERFFPATRAFHLDVPAGWQQLSPGALKELQQRHRDLPTEFARTEPGMFYVVGPLAQWLQEPFAPPFLYVVEQDQEWFTDDDFAGKIAASWRERNRDGGPTHTVTDIQKEKLAGGHEVITAIRTTLPGNDQPPLQSLDVHAPTGGRQVSLAFTTAAANWERDLPEFRKMLATLTFARRAKGGQTLSDRLWTPLLVGGLVGLVLVVLYRWNRRSVGAADPPQ